MDHGYFEDRISAYRDKGLPADEYELIRQHLEECESCRKLHDRLERFDRLVRDNAELGDDLYWEKAAQKIEQRLGIAETVVTPVAKKSVWSGLGWKISAAAASLVLIAIVAINKDKIFREDELMAPATTPVVTDTVRPQSADVPDTSGQTSQAMRQAEPEVAADSYDGEPADDQPPVESSRMRKVAPEMTGTQSAMKAEESTASLEARRETQPTATAQPPEEIEQSAPSMATTRPESNAASAEAQVDVQADTQSEPVTVSPGPVVASRSARPEMSVSESVPAVDTVDRVRLAELESWRAVKDSLESFLYERKNENMFDAMKPNSLQSDKRAKATQAAADPKIGVERQYLEACYQIARLATDPLEAQSAKDRLRRVAGNPESPNREAARTLLDRLAAGK